MKGLTRRAGTRGAGHLLSTIPIRHRRQQQTLDLVTGIGLSE